MFIKNMNAPIIVLVPVITDPLIVLYVAKLKKDLADSLAHNAELVVDYIKILAIVKKKGSLNQGDLTKLAIARRLHIQKL